MTLKEGGQRGSLRNVGVGVSEIPDSGNLQAQYVASSFDLSDGDSITTNWADTAGNNDAILNGAPIFRTNQLNGEPAVDFDGVDDYFDTRITPDTTAAQSLYIVGYIETTDAYLYDSVDTSGTTNRFYGGRMTGNAELAIGHGDMGAIGGFYNRNTWLIRSTVYNNGDGEAWKNGSSEVSGTGSGIGTTPSVYIGARNNSGSAESFADARIAEILHYDVEHNTTTRNNVEAYLNDKYAVF